MVSAEEFTAIALALPGTIAAPHGDRTAFKVHRIYATLAPDGRSANLMLKLDEQALKCAVAPYVFTALDNGWGRRGATCLDLHAAIRADVEATAALAHAHAIPKRPPR